MTGKAQDCRAPPRRATEDGRQRRRHAQPRRQGTRVHRTRSHRPDGEALRSEGQDGRALVLSAGRHTGVNRGRLRVPRPQGRVRAEERGDPRRIVRHPGREPALRREVLVQLPAPLRYRPDDRDRLRRQRGSAEGRAAGRRDHRPGRQDQGVARARGRPRVAGGGCQDAVARPSPGTVHTFRGGPLMNGVVTLIALLIALLSSVPRVDAPQPPLVVTGYGGRWSEVMKKALVEPFEKKHNVKVEVVTGISTEWVAKLMAAGPDNPPSHAVSGTQTDLPTPPERGFFDKRNDTLAPNIKNLYPKALIGETSLAMFWGRIGLTHRTHSGGQKPVSWKDFWDDAYTGKRATYVIGNTLGINFLFVISKIFGKDYFDIDAGVAAIKKAQPKLVDFSGTIEKQLEQKEVVLAVHHDAGANDLKNRGIPVDWVAPTAGTPILDQVVQVTRGSKNKELAWKLIDAYLSPEVQTAFATELFWSPTNKTVKLPADVARKGIGPGDIDKPVLFDWAQVAKQRPQWTEKWNREMR